MQPQFITKTKTLVLQLVKILNTFNAMKFADLSMSQLGQLRKDIVLNSLFVSDYVNSLDMPSTLVCDFFEGYMDFLCELEMEKYGKSDMDFGKFFDEFDNQNNLEEWYCCHDNFGDEEMWDKWESLDEDERDYYDGFAEYYNLNA